MAKSEQKACIVAYRNEGLSYKEIADKLGVSIEYARNIYSREQRSQDAIPIASEDSCRFCGNPIKSTEGKKKRIFCSQKCRDAFRYQKKKHEPFIRLCEHCKKEFVAYGNPTKRFCCRECQKLARRQGE